MLKISAAWRNSSSFPKPATQTLEQQTLQTHQDSPTTSTVSDQLTSPLLRGQPNDSINERLLLSLRRSKERRKRVSAMCVYGFAVSDGVGSSDGRSWEVWTVVGESLRRRRSVGLMLIMKVPPIWRFDDVGIIVRGTVLVFFMDFLVAVLGVCYRFGCLLSVWICIYVAAVSFSAGRLVFGDVDASVVCVAWCCAERVLGSMFKWKMQRTTSVAMNCVSRSSIHNVTSSRKYEWGLLFLFSLVWHIHWQQVVLALLWYRAVWSCLRRCRYSAVSDTNVLIVFFSL